MIKIGANGKRVWELQQLLVGLGYDIIIDGIFGPNTDKSVRDYQQSHNIEVDGVVGPTTLNMMRSNLSRLRTTGKNIIGNHIVDVARRYVGSYEVVGNRKWSGTDYAAHIPQELLDVGWSPGWAYCASFAESIWKIAYCDDLPETFSRAMTPSVIQSYNNFQKLNLVSQNPVPGSVVLMRYGLSQLGHAGILEYSDDRKIYTIEGNTSPSPDIATDREGDGIYARSRDFDFTRKTRGLYLLGFINPM